MSNTVALGRPAPFQFRAEPLHRVCANLHQLRSIARMSGCSLHVAGVAQRATRGMQPKAACNHGNCEALAPNIGVGSQGGGFANGLSMEEAGGLNNA